MKDFPYVYLTGRTPEEAMIRLAAFASDRGRQLHKDYTVTFVNDPFEIE